MIAKRVGDIKISEIFNLKKLYEYFIKHCLKLESMTCSCGCTGNLVRHGYYERKVKTPFGTMTIKILRVKCKTCGKTHAVLPDCIVPYSQVPLESMIEILRFEISDQEIQNIMNENSDITEGDVRYIKAQYKKNWKTRIASIGISLQDKIEEIFEKVSSHYLKAFMQNNFSILYIPS